MLVELNVVEQRYQAVLEVLNQGASVTDVARRNGVSRQTVHLWLRRYATQGLAGLADGSAKPLSCPHQMTPGVEARACGCSDPACAADDSWLSRVILPALTATEGHNTWTTTRVSA